MKTNINNTTEPQHDAKLPVRCSVCGCFMRRLKLLEKVRLGLLPDTNYTHICKRSSISYETGVMEHE
jgi:hypothetical protein